MEALEAVAFLVAAYLEEACLAGAYLEVVAGSTGSDFGPCSQFPD